MQLFILFYRPRTIVISSFDAGAEIMTFFAPPFIACVIENFAEDILNTGRLYKINLIEKIPPRSISIAWLKNFPLTAAARELVKHLEYSESSEF